MVSSVRDEMIESNIGLVHSIAKKFIGRGADYDDLFQSGCVGLIKAVDNFDESRGYAFSTYAVPVIMGEIKRIFRDGGAIKVSRSLKEKANKVQAKRDEFVKKEMREPTISELSAIFDTSPEEMNELLNVVQPILSLSSNGEDGDESIDVPIDESDQLFDRISIDQLMKRLDDTERAIVDLRYYKGYTQSTTAKQIGISQVQVSRREKKLLMKLRELLE